MKKSGEHALLIALGKAPKSGEEEESESVSSKDAEKKAAEEIIAALNVKDADALASALKAFVMACDVDDYEESDEE